MGVRAIYRRQLREARKVKKSKANEDINRILFKAKADGRSLGFCCVGIVMHKRFGWGKARLDKLLESAGAESLRTDNEAVSFVISLYREKVNKKICATGILEQTNDVRKSIYIINRNDYFILTVALLLETLNDKFGFGTKRIEEIIEYITNEYVRFNLSKITPDDYKDKLKEETRFDVRG